MAFLAFSSASTAPKFAHAKTNRGFASLQAARVGSLAPRRAQLMIRAVVKVGDKAPDFTLKNEAGKPVKLSSFQGIFGKPVVLYFYPADGTPGCTKQAQAFKDSISAFKKAGAEVLGVSGDDVESHVAFKKDLGLPFPLLADEGNEVRKQYGIPKDLFGVLEGRQTYVIAKDGTVKLIFNNQFQPEKHVEEALKALA